MIDGPMSTVGSYLCVASFVAGLSGPYAPRSAWRFPEQEPLTVTFVLTAKQSACPSACQSLLLRSFASSAEEQANCHENRRQDVEQNIPHHERDEIRDVICMPTSANAGGYRQQHGQESQQCPGRKESR